MEWLASRLAMKLAHYMGHQAVNQPRWLSLKGASRYSSLSDRTIQKLISLGLLKSKLLKMPGTASGRRLIDRESLDRIIESEGGQQ